ncbi:glycosyltransferase, partial [Klebsiella pneumoniae]|nr:glycosyltransferase [Klebsiella pneumoniae]
AVEVAYPGVHQLAGPIPSPDRSSVTGPRIGTCGRLIHRKGHDLVLRAMPAVLERVPAARYVVAGAGPLRDALAALSRELG